MATGGDWGLFPMRLGQLGDQPVLGPPGCREGSGVSRYGVAYLLLTLGQLKDAATRLMILLLLAVATFVDGTKADGSAGP